MFQTLFPPSFDINKSVEKEELSLILFKKVESTENFLPAVNYEKDCDDESVMFTSLHALDANESVEKEESLSEEDESPCYHDYNESVEDSPSTKDCENDETDAENCCWKEYLLPNFDQKYDSLEKLESYLSDFCCGKLDDIPKGYALSKYNGNPGKSVNFKCDKSGVFMSRKIKLENTKSRKTSSKKTDCEVVFHAYCDYRDGYKWKLIDKVLTHYCTPNNIYPHS